MQTTLLGLAIAFIIALIAALVGPYFIDWNQFRPQFEAEATRIVGAPVRVGGKLDARLLPAPSLQLHSVVVGGANDLGKVRANKLDVEFSLGSLMRGEVRATELTINGMSVDLGLDAKGRIDWPASTGTVNLGSLAIDRLNLTGRIALHDAASRSTLELNDIAFSGDVRSLAGWIRGDGNFMLSGTRYPFRVSSGQGPDGNGTRVHLNIDPGQRALAIDLDGVLNFDARAPRFEGAMTLAAPAAQKGKGDELPWRIAAKVKADYSAARLEQVEVTYGPEERALKLSGNGDIRFGATPLLRAVLSARQLDADRFVAKDNAAEPARALPALRALTSVVPHLPVSAQIELASEQVMLGGRPLQDIAAELHGDDKSWSLRRLEFRAPGATRVSLSETGAKSVAPDRFKAALSVESSDPEALLTWLQGRGEIAYRSQKPLRLRGDVTVAPEGFAIDAMKADIEGGTVEGRVVVSHRQAIHGSRVDAELKAERLDLDAATAFARSLAGPQGEWPDEGKAFARYRPRHLRRTGAESAACQTGLLAGEGIARAVEDRPARKRDAGRRGQFRPRQRDRMVRAQFECRFARSVDQPDRSLFTGAGRADQCNGDQPRPGAPEAGARSHQQCRAVRSRPGARHSRARLAAAQGRHHDHRKANRGGNPGRRSRRAPEQRRWDRVEIVVRARPRLARFARPRSRRHGGRRPGAIRGQRDGRVGRAVAPQGKDLGDET
ncbi:AsmA family protein [Bradyrhizobium sp. AZCC 1610]|uniref:AsmA family protein n=1 Tax=Bradyrhizobium sp. AZCC 1610 TaxID=3117020 RepID=UPI002FF40D48